VSQFFTNLHKKSYGLFLIVGYTNCIKNEIDIYLQFSYKEGKVLNIIQRQRA